MINPGVLVLASKTISKTYACIEDNVGESIHFHYGNIRLDLSINEFLEISEKMTEAAKELLGPIANQLFDYDPVFLNYISHHLCDLESIKDDTIELIKIICNGFVYKRMTGPVYLNKSSRYLALQGKTALYESVDRDKPLFMTHLERLNSVREFVKNNQDIGNIVLINDTNVIIDGQHRAACMLFDQGNKTISIKRFYFKNYNLNYRVRRKSFYFVKSLKYKIIGFAKKLFRR